MLKEESIQDMYTRFSAIVNEIYSLGELIPIGKAIRKLLSILPKPWESKVEVITKTRDLDMLTMDELIRNLLTYKLKKNQEKELNDKCKEKNLVHKATEKDDYEEENIALVTKCMLRKGQSN